MIYYFKKKKLNTLKSKELYYESIKISIINNPKIFKQ